ncbi:MAG: F0F1 ATP synthase subunit gamma [Candidatus Saccharimonadales bacterium]
MKQQTDLARDRDTMSTVVELTSAFEGIASMHISQIKDQVLSSQKFFDDLWRIYRQIRVDEQFHFGRRQSKAKVIPKELIIIVTAEGSFSGDIDQRIITEVLARYKPEKNDILIIGSHGAVQLTQRGTPYIKSFNLPASDASVDVAPIISEIQKYEATTMYYPAYVSLMTQAIKNIELSVEVTERGRSVAQGEDIITESNYIFEPSTHAVVSHLERSMAQIMVGEIILESKLAQYASRFRAMNAARSKADESFHSLAVDYSRAKRRYKDERLKEITNGLRKGKA